MLRRLAEKRLSLKRAVGPTRFIRVPPAIVEELTEKQKAALCLFLLRSWVVLHGGRRSGKTRVIMVALVLAALSRADSLAVYFSTTITRAAETIGEPLRKLLEKHKITFRYDRQKHIFHFPNGSAIYLSGFETKADADAWRGRIGLALAAVDEMQDHREELVNYFLNSVLEAGRADNQAPIILSGTPGLLSGTWHQAVHSSPSPIYGHAAWNLDENPHLPDWKKVIREACQRRGVTEDDEEIQREFFAKWIPITQRAVFPAYLVVAPIDAPIQGQCTGADVGSVDLMAGVKIRWSKRRAWVTFAKQQRLPSFPQQFAFIDECSDGSDMTVIDPGGGGKSHLETFHQQGRLNFIGADKKEKAAALRDLRDAIRSQRLVCETPFPELQAALNGVQWNKDQSGTLGHCPDIVDALLYVWRYVAQFMTFADEPEEPVTPEEQELLDMYERQEAVERESRFWE